MSPPPTTFHPSPSQIHQTRFILLRLLPLELVDPILHTAHYYTLHTSLRTTRRVLHDCAEEYVVSARMTGKEVREVRFRIESHDQGWSDCPEYDGGCDGSWTWFEAKLGRGEGEEGWVVAKNLRAVGEWQVHQVVWDHTHEMVSKIQKGDSVALRTVALYPGWLNYVRRAEIDIFCWL
ncbi:hypothetical protein JAAARDRAFT_193567 [Jaapia argillacea MUCL 33604]|uniref:Uncharacterized protein n=1 Tax=Jaapia argillacea MUCL 33604 TaxID=933084 RepID=A0A067Q3P5_9AGAM|nr:hypothetical protein JAAARDRAFT_193567 [Jaapia argillacea MUCL 33604]